MATRAADLPDAWAAAPSPWVRFEVRSVDDLHSSIHGARPDCGWDAVQLSPGRLAGSVVHGGCRGVSMTSSRIEGNYELKGVLASEGMTFAVGLELATPTRQWLCELGEGSGMVVTPGDQIDSRMQGVSLYLTTVATVDQLLAEARLEGVEIADTNLVTTGVLPTRIEPHNLGVMTNLLQALHSGQDLALPPGARVEEMILAMLVEQLAKTPAPPGRVNHGAGYARIVARARAFIDSHLESPISIDEIAAAAFASRRTLHRAFDDILGETPQSYVLKLRLNRIRQDLASPAEAERTVTMVSLRWGIGELGRLAARYREQFGELPSETLARRRYRQADATGG